MHVFTLLLYFVSGVTDMAKTTAGEKQEGTGIRPTREATKIILIYTLTGVLWILLSDKILDFLIKDNEVYDRIQLIKGWFYVSVTAVIFYFIIKQRLKLLKQANDRIVQDYTDLTAAHGKLMKAEETLLSQYEELKKNQTALIISDQRYKLAVEGSSDGIWDYDLQSGTYFFSIKDKEMFGYEKVDLGDTLEALTFLVHPDDCEKAIGELDTYLKTGKGVYESIFRLRCKNGEYRWVLSRGKALCDETEKPVRMAGSHTDITNSENAKRKLHELAYYDQLTKLPNRIFFEEEGDKLLQIAAANQTKIAVLIFDLDNFKHINDIMGNDAGNQLLIETGNSLAAGVRAPDFTARLGGDEYGVIMTDVKNEEDLSLRCGLILHRIKKFWQYNDREFYVTCSSGLAMFPDHGTDFSSLLKNADIAMYHSKENGKDKLSIFTPPMAEITMQHLQMNNQLRAALINDLFLLHYQPQVDIKTGKIIGTEALIRLDDLETGFVSPSVFIPYSEKAGLIHQIDMWALKTAIKQRKEWEEKGYTDIRMMINLSGKTLIHPMLIPEVKSLLEQVGLSAGTLEFEITETAVIADFDASIEVLRNLKELGASIALDDFGIGYSSLTYLQKLPIDVLKIDREFIKNIIDKNEEGFIFKAMVELAHTLNLKVVAEGVETEEQLAFLRKNNCDYAQGFYFSRPQLPVAIEGSFGRKQK